MMLRKLIIVFIAAVFGSNFLIISHYLHQNVDDGRPKSEQQQISFSLEENHGYPVVLHTELGPYLPANDDVTWVTQLSSDRVDVFLELLKRWKGPVSVTMYTDTFNEDLQLLREVQSSFRKIDIHYVIASLSYFPVNLLRNIAIDKARSDFILLADADFLPNVDAYEKIMESLPRWKTENLKTIRVLPAFEMNTTCAQMEPPRTKAELIAMGNCVNQVHKDPLRNVAHAHTRYDLWRTTEKEYNITYGQPFEPYYVAHKSVIRYDTNFIYYGYNKAVQAEELAAAGWKFVGIPSSFVVHINHGPGPWLVLKLLPPLEVLDSVTVGFRKRIERKYSRPPPALPPVPQWAQESFTIAKGRRGHDCDKTCEKKGLSCDDSLFPHINSCELLEKNFFCFLGCVGNVAGPDLPNFDQVYQRCLINYDVGQSSCKGAHGDTKRLCPCVLRNETSPIS